MFWSILLVIPNHYKKMGEWVFQDRGTRTAILVRGTQDSDFSLGDPGQEPGHFESFIPFTIFYFLKVKFIILFFYFEWVLKIHQK